MIVDELRRTCSTTWTTWCALGRAVHALQARAVAGRLRRPAGAAARPAARRPGDGASGSRAPTATSWSTSTRTPTALQAEIVRGLAATHDNVMAVGDDARASTRSAAPTSATSWTSRRSSPGRALITLEENYRSTQPILDLANAIIDRAPERYTKVLRAQAQAGAAPGAGARRGRPQPVALRLPAHPRAARGGRAARRDRRALPLELPLLRPRARAAAARHPVRQARRLQVHRDGARQGRARASARGREPARRGVLASRAAAARRARAEDGRRRAAPRRRGRGRRRGGRSPGGLSAARRVHQGARPSGPAPAPAWPSGSAARASR